jgi:hypothetical protein
VQTPAQHVVSQTKYESSTLEKKKRAARNKARRLMIREGKAHKGDGKDVDHRSGNPLNDSKSNLRVISRHHNRSYPRTASGGKVHPGVT